jgi:type II secretory pathway pseudopilin PulG
VAVIVAVLAAVAIPAYSGYIQSSKERVALNTAGTIAAALAAYYSEWPTFAPSITGETEVVAIGAGNSVRIPEGYTVDVDGTNVTVDKGEEIDEQIVRWKEGS